MPNPLTALMVVPLTPETATPGASSWATGDFALEDLKHVTIDPGLGSGGYFKVRFKHKEDDWEDDPADDTRDRIRCNLAVGDVLRMRVVSVVPRVALVYGTGPALVYDVTLEMEGKKRKR